MNRPEVLRQIERLNQARLKLFGKKSDDYATEDALSNFKRMNKICATLDIDPRRSPTDCALFLMMLKIDRWCNLRRGKTPQNESLKDTVIDLHNYVDLGWLNDKESNG